VRQYQHYHANMLELVSSLSHVRNGIPHNQLVCGP